jgi:hypothetical protein
MDTTTAAALANFSRGYEQGLLRALDVLLRSGDANEAIARLKPIIFAGASRRAAREAELAKMAANEADDFLRLLDEVEAESTHQKKGETK